MGLTNVLVLVVRRRWIVGARGVGEGKGGELKLPDTKGGVGEGGHLPCSWGEDRRCCLVGGSNPPHEPRLDRGKPASSWVPLATGPRARATG